MSLAGLGFGEQHGRLDLIGGGAEGGGGAGGGLGAGVLLVAHMGGVGGHCSSQNQTDIIRNIQGKLTQTTKGTRAVSSQETTSIRGY